MAKKKRRGRNVGEKFTSTLIYIVRCVSRNSKHKSIWGDGGQWDVWDGNDMYMA